MQVYRMKYRPVSFCTLPSGLQWQWHKAPADLASRLGVPASDWRFGEFTTARPLTNQELADFEIEKRP